MSVVIVIPFALGYGLHLSRLDSLYREVTTHKSGGVATLQRNRFSTTRAFIPLGRGLVAVAVGIDGQPA